MSQTHLEVDLLQRSTGGVVDERLSEGDDPLPDSGARSLDHDEVVLDDTISDKASHRCDGLDGSIKVGGGRGGVVGLSNTVNLLVEFCSERQSVVLTLGSRSMLTSTVVVSVLRGEEHVSR